MSLTILAAISGILHIYFDYQKNTKASYLFKPLVCFLLIIMVLLYGQEAPSNYRNWILAGLFFSIIGDICLMLEKEKFIQGLASFFLAHLCYIMAFLLFIEMDNKIPWISYFALLVIASFVWVSLKEGVSKESNGKLKLPVIAYIAVIVVMVMLARTWMTQAAQGSYIGLTLSAASFAYVGALFFMASDTNLAINKFKRSYHWAQLVTLSTYYIAQILIARSVLMLVI